MTQVFDPNHSHSALVFVRTQGSKDIAPMRRRARTGAVRGTSPYLGQKASDLSVYAKRLGRFPSSEHGEPGASPVPTKPAQGGLSSGVTRPSVVAEAPRLYHGLPSGDEGEDIPAESARAIDSLATELMALEGRLHIRASSDSETASRDQPSRPEASGGDHHQRASDSAAHSSEDNSNRTLPSGAAPEDEPLDGEGRRWDEFGRDTRAIERFSPIARFLANRYFRTIVTGTEHLPPRGPCLLVANHSGALPIDGLVLSCALSQAMPERGSVRWLTEDFVQNLQFVGTFLQRLGAVRASRENALRLLQRGECVVAFPEGFKGYAKPHTQWYRVQRLGRGRIVGLCLQAGVPLYPCAIVGGEEASPSLRRLEAVERWLGTPYFPITPTFPWLGPLGLLPVPSRWRIDIGPAFLTGKEPASSDDPLYVAELTSRLRTVLQERLEQLLRRRQSTWS